MAQARKKVSELDATTSLASGDFIPVVDVSDTTQGASGSTKKITFSNLTAGLAAEVGLEDHIADTTTHGTTGNIVGASDAQTLTNKTISASSNTLSNIAVSNLAGSAVVTESETIASNDNDTTLPTSAAVKDYVDGVIPAVPSNLEDLDDVVITSVADNEVLAYDATSGDWINQTKAEAGLAASGANSDITSLSALSTPLSVAQGGTGVATIGTGNVVIGAGTSAVTSSKAAPSGDFVGTSDTQTLTGKTIDGDDNTVQDLAYSSIKSTSRSGADTTLVTGTAGTSGDLSIWNADGDLVDGPTPPSGTIVGTSDTQTLTNKTLTSPKINEDVAVTSTATEINVLDGIPSTLTATELGYVDGVTSAIQTQIDGKPTISSGAGAPASTPTKVGDVYIDTTGDDAYTAVGTASSSDWEKNNDGGGGGGIDDGDKGDITVSGSGATWTIDNDVVTYAKMQNVVGDNVILGNNAGAGGVVDELSASEVRTILNVEDGADVTDTANVTSAGALMDSEVDADIKTLSLPASTTISTFGASIIDDADEATFKATVNLEIGTDVQAYNATLAAVAGGTYSGDDSIVTVGTLSAGNATAIVDSASTGAAGKVELATTAETETGTDAGRAVTPDGLHDMTTLAGAAWFLDEDNFASNDHTKVPSQQSVKAYVDTAIVTAVGITWNEVTGTSQTAAVNNGYIVDNESLVTVTIPTTAAVGDIVRVVGKGAGGWAIAQNASESINFGSSTTTVGTGGSLASTHRYDAVELVCTSANTTWTVISSVGNITVV